MPVRNFTWSNLPNLLDFIGAVQAQTAHDRPLRQKSFQEALQEPGLDPESNCLLLLQDQEILGCCLVFPETPIRRAVLALDAAPNIEGSGQEAELVRRAIRRSQELNAGVAHICLAPGSPRKALLEQENFHLGRVYLDLVWQGDQLPLLQLPNHLTVRSFQPGDAPALTQIQNDAFTGSWGFCPNTVEQIEYRTGLSNTSHQGILFLHHDGDLAGYCWTVIAPSGGKTRGIIGMIGVAPQFRGQGISRPILLAGMEYLQSAGVDEIGLHVDGDNTPAVRLYHSVGFAQVGELHWYEATL